MNGFSRVSACFGSEDSIHRPFGRPLRLGGTLDSSIYIDPNDAQIGPFGGPEAADPKEYEGIKWQRFESLPSSMFFTLLNLCKEHPLAEKFGAEGNAALAFFQRLNVVVVCIVGVPVFGVPTGILGASLMKHCRPPG